MIIVKSLNLNLHQNSISFKHCNIKDSLNLQITATVDGSDIQSITGWWNSHKFEILGSGILKESPYKQKTFLLTLLNYIGTKNLSSQISEDPDIDPIQKTINTFVVSIGYYLIIQKFYSVPEFNTYFENPFGDQRLSWTQSLYKFKFLKSFKVIHQYLKPFKGLFPSEVQTYAQKIELLKSTITDLLRHYQWSPVCETINSNKKEFWSFLNSSTVQKIYNNIQFDIQTLSLLASRLRNPKIIENPAYQYYQDLQKNLILESGNLPEAPFNYPNVYHLELYDAISGSLEYQNSQRISNIRETYQPEIYEITEKIESLDEKSEDLQNKLVKKRIAMMSEIQKIDLETNNEKVEIQKIVRKTLKNFEILESLEFKGPKVLQDIKIQYQEYLQNLRNQLWQIYRQIQETKKTATYQDQKLRILKFNNSLKTAIEIVEKIVGEKYLYFEDLKAILESNLGVYQSNLDIQVQVYIEYQKYLDTVLKNLVKFRYTETKFTEYTFGKLVIPEIENLFIDQEQHTILLESIDQSIMIQVDFGKLESLGIKGQIEKIEEKKMESVIQEVKAEKIEDIKIEDVKIKDWVVESVPKVTEIIDLSPFEIIGTPKKVINNEDLYQKILELTQLVMDLKAEISKK